MSDLISRQALMKEFSDFVRESNNSDFAQTPTWNDAVSLVGSMPSAQQWIPCSERLPNEGQVVLTQAKFKHDIKFCVSSRQDFNYWTGWNTREINVVAWMPLPEPWKGSEK